MLIRLHAIDHVSNLLAFAEVVKISVCTEMGTGCVQLFLPGDVTLPVRLSPLPKVREIGNITFDLLVTRILGMPTVIIRPDGSQRSATIT